MSHYSDGTSTPFDSSAEHALAAQLVSARPDNTVILRSLDGVYQEVVKPQLDTDDSVRLADSIHQMMVGLLLHPRRKQIQELETANSRIAELEAKDSESERFCKELICLCSDGLRALHRLPKK